MNDQLAMGHDNLYCTITKVGGLDQELGQQTEAID